MLIIYSYSIDKSMPDLRWPIRERQGFSDMKIHFPPARIEDMEDILRMMKAFYEEEGYPFHRESRSANLLRLLDKPGLGRLWLVSADGNVAGYVVLGFGFSFEYHGRDAFIDELYIREEYRSKGLGRKTMAFVEDQAIGLGIHALHLEVEHGNAKARKLYQARGYAGKTRDMWTKWILPDG